jgi:hypothetical protein
MGVYRKCKPVSVPRDLPVSYKARPPSIEASRIHELKAAVRPNRDRKDAQDRAAVSIIGCCAQRVVDEAAAA